MAAIENPSVTLLLDMAKELSMIENNKIGCISRKYFIAIDKAFKARHLQIFGQMRNTKTLQKLS